MGAGSGAGTGAKAKARTGAGTRAGAESFAVYSGLTYCNSGSRTVSGLDAIVFSMTTTGCLISFICCFTNILFEVDYDLEIVDDS